MRSIQTEDLRGIAIFALNEDTSHDYGMPLIANLAFQPYTNANLPYMGAGCRHFHNMVLSRDARMLVLVHKCFNQIMTRVKLEVFVIETATTRVIARLELPVRSWIYSRTFQTSGSWKWTRDSFRVEFVDGEEDDLDSSLGTKRLYVINYGFEENYDPHTAIDPPIQVWIVDITPQDVWADPCDLFKHGPPPLSSPKCITAPVSHDIYFTNYSSLANDDLDGSTDCRGLHHLDIKPQLNIGVQTLGAKKNEYEAYSISYDLIPAPSPFKRYSFVAPDAGTQTASISGMAPTRNATRQLPPLAFIWDARVFRESSRKIMHKPKKPGKRSARFVGENSQNSGAMKHSARLEEGAVVFPDRVIFF